MFIKSKIQFFESKSQLHPLVSRIIVCCLSSQRYNFLKANHNAVVNNSNQAPVVYQVKDTIFWKQITTCTKVWTTDVLLFIKSKIQFFESKSQRSIIVSHNHPSCLSSQRYNFLKANHNKIKIKITIHTVVYQVKDTIFWKQITTFS